MNFSKYNIFIDNLTAIFYAIASNLLYFIAKFLFSHEYKLGAVNLKDSGFYRGKLIFANFFENSLNNALETGFLVKITIKTNLNRLK